MTTRLSGMEKINYCGLMYLSGACSALFGALLPYLYERSILTFSQAGTLQTISNFVMAAFTLFIGFVIDRFRASLIYIPSFLLMVAAYLLYGLSGSLLTVGASFIVLSLGSNMMQTVFNLNFSKRVQFHPGIFNAVNSFFSIAGIFTPIVLAAFVSMSGGWLGYMVMMAALTCVFGVITLRLQNVPTTMEASQAAAGGVEPAADVLRPKACVITTIMFSFSTMVQILFSTWLVVFLVQSGAISVEAAQLSLSFFWVGNMLARLIWPLILRVINYNALLFAAAVLSTLTSAGILFVRGWVLMPLACLVGLSSGGFYPTLVADLSKNTGGKATVFCLCTFASSMISMGGSYLMGIMFERLGSSQGFSLVPIIAMALAAVAAGKLFLFERKKKPANG